jgi:hypothetical protein
MTGRAAFGASGPLPGAQAKVSQLNRQRSFSRRGGNRPSCPQAVPHSSYGRGVESDRLPVHGLSHGGAPLRPFH